jgi:thioredoxin reductase (NADPH)
VNEPEEKESAVSKNAKPEDASTEKSSTEKINSEQLIIIGSGPSGYSAAIYAARAGLKPLVLAGSVTAGGALMNTTEVENFPGFPEGVQGPELMDGLQQQAEKFGAQVVFDDATRVQLKGHLKRVVTGGGEIYEAPAVILATGSAYKELGLSEEKKFSGHGVSWCATCDGFFFRDQDIIVVGGGDSAMEEATFLTRFGKSVTVVVRKGELRASRIMAQRAKDNPKITFAWNSAVTAIHGNGKVSGVTLTDTRSGETRKQPPPGFSWRSGTCRAPNWWPGRWSSTPRATSGSIRPPPAPTSVACSRVATPWTTATARRSPPPAPAARRPSTPSGTWPRWRMRTASPRHWSRSPPTPEPLSGGGGGAQKRRGRNGCADVGRRRKKRRC